MKLFSYIVVALGCVASATGEARAPAGSDYDLRSYRSSDIETLRFTNRAQCAVDSDKAAQSIFLFADSYIVGKAANSHAKAIGADPKNHATKAMRSFRETVQNLSLHILQSLQSGELSLLPRDQRPSSPNLISIWTTLQTKCLNEGYCAELDHLLKPLWNSNSRSRPLGGEVSCNYVKSFDGLHAHLQASKPNADTLNNIARSALSKDPALTRCQSMTDSDDLLARRFAIQWDILKQTTTQEKQWLNSTGFDYWHSYKIYMSWAWRNVDLMSFGAGSFGKLFKSLNLEESLLFAPNGCRSMTPPSCDQNYISTAALRDFAKKANPDAGEALPEGPADDLIRTPTPGVNDGSLGQAKAKDTDEWLEFFQKQMNGTSLQMKKRLHDGLNTLSIFTNKNTQESWIENLKNEIKKNQNSPDAHQALYVLCAEYNLAENQDFSFLREELQKYTRLASFEKYVPSFHKDKLARYHTYFTLLSGEILELCEEMHKDDFWPRNFEVDRQYYSDWFRDAMGALIPGDTDLEAKPLPRIPTPTSSIVLGNKTFCNSSVDCARTFLQGMIDVHASTSYVDSMLPFREDLKDTPLFNPYAERKACKVYDPWFKTNKAIKELMVGLGNAALFSWNPAPLFIEADFRPGQVVNLKEYIQNGKLKYNPEIKGKKVIITGGIDFGPLTGVPCRVAVANNARVNMGSRKFLPLVGVNIQACKSREDFALNVYSPSNINNDEELSLKGCLNCYLNVEGATYTALALAEKAATGASVGFYLLRAAMRFFHTRSDPLNIPRDWSIDVNLVSQEYLRYKGIPKDCVGRLLKGKSCFTNRCSMRAVDHVEGRLSGLARASSFETKDRYNHVVKVESASCKGDFTFQLSAVRLRSSHRNRGLFEGSKSCRTSTRLQLKLSDASGQCAQSSFVKAIQKKGGR